MSVLPPLEKLPIAIRKNLRDKFEEKKSDIEATLSKALGETWTVEINPLAVFPYAEERYAKENFGAMITDYFEAAASHMKDRKDSVKAEINKLASEHVMTLEVDDQKRFNYCGSVISDSKWRLVFLPNRLSHNLRDAANEENITKALNEAGKTAGGVSFVSRQNIEKDYEPFIADVSSSIEGILGKPLKLEPNFDENFAKVLQESQKPKTDLARHWEKAFGKFTIGYFKGLQSQLEWQKFKGDDMLTEGFFDAVDKETVVIRIVDKLEGANRRNEAVIKDGVLYIQTTAGQWGVNANDAANKLTDML